MVKEIIGVAGLSQSGKSVVSGFLKKKRQALLLDHQEILATLFKPGEEGYRQIINYFGEEFVRKNGQLNLRKLWKFLYTDLHKLRIWDFLMQPLIIDRCQKMIDGAEADLVVVEQLYFIDKNWQKLLTKRVWVERKYGSQTSVLVDRFNLPLQLILDVQKRLYLRPEKDYIVLSNDSTLSQFEKQIAGCF